jgi:hypothetical protein
MTSNMVTFNVTYTASEGGGPMATRSRRTQRAVLVSCILAFVVSSQHAFASTTWTVRKDGTGQFTTINAAKAAATTGDVIDVGPGTYPEEIDFNYSVTLESTDGAATTILDGEHIRRLLIFRAGTGSVVDGFTIRNGIQVSSGGGLRVQLGATCTMRNCILEGNHSDFDGGAIITRDAGTELDVFDCTIRNNTADRHAAGALFLGSSVAKFTRCRFEGNIGSASGAVAMDDFAVFIARDCLYVRGQCVAEQHDIRGRSCIDLQAEHSCRRHECHRLLRRRHHRESGLQRLLAESRFHRKRIAPPRRSGSGPSLLRCVA